MIRFVFSNCCSLVHTFNYCNVGYIYLYGMHQQVLIVRDHRTYLHECRRSIYWCTVRCTHKVITELNIDMALIMEAIKCCLEEEIVNAPGWGFYGVEQTRLDIEKCCAHIRCVRRRCFDGAAEARKRLYMLVSFVFILLTTITTYIGMALHYRLYTFLFLFFPLRIRWKVQEALKSHPPLPLLLLLFYRSTFLKKPLSKSPADLLKSYR